jgi:hypothetical protein
MGTMDFQKEWYGQDTIDNPGKHREALPRHEFTIVHGAISPNNFYDRNKPWATQAASNIDNQQYNVVRVINEPADVGYVMAPGRPQDRGSFEKSVMNSNPLQRRTVVQKLAMAANAPYTGIYTGLKGYVDE